MIAVRWLDGNVRCPYLRFREGDLSRKGEAYRCYGDHPKQKFSLKIGTVFEDSPIALEKWLSAVWLLVNCKNGISSYELHRALGVTQKWAWFMLHRIRLAMQSQFVRETWAGQRCSDGGQMRVSSAGRPGTCTRSPQMSQQGAPCGYDKATKWSVLWSCRQTACWSLIARRFATRRLERETKNLKIAHAESDLFTDAQGLHYQGVAPGIWNKVRG